MQFSAISAQIYDSPAHQLTILLLTLAGVKPGSTENHENAILKIKESTGIKASFDSYALCQSGVTEPENRHQTKICSKLHHFNSLDAW